MIRAVGKGHGGWQDAWLDPEMELVVSCDLLVLSGIYFWARVAAIQDWQSILSTVTVVLGPWFVYRAWNRH
jgi:hypothetical protein